jgi:two-component system response regulator HydG
LHVVPIEVPPLRERIEDIPRLCAHFVAKLGPRTNPAVRGFDHAALARLSGYGWPGNVRELENVVEQSLVFAEGERIDLRALPAFLKAPTSENALAMPPGNMSLTEILEDLERQLIEKAYDKAAGVKTECARLLGVKTSALYYKLEKYGIGAVAPRGGAAATTDVNREGAPGQGAASAEHLLGDGPAAPSTPGGGGESDR